MKIFGFIYLNKESDRSESDIISEQRSNLLEYAHTERFLIDEFILLESLFVQNLTTLNVHAGDVLLLSDLRDVNKSIAETLHFLTSLSKQKIQLISLAQPALFTLHEHISINSVYQELTNLIVKNERKSINIKDLDRELSISVRILSHRKITKIQVYDIKSNYQESNDINSNTNTAPKRIGRPIGTGGKSKLDQFRNEITELLNNGSTQRFIAKRYSVSYQNLNVWLKRQGIV